MKHLRQWCFYALRFLALWLLLSLPRQAHSGARCQEKLYRLYHWKHQLKKKATLTNHVLREWCDMASTLLACHKKPDLIKTIRAAYLPKGTTLNTKANAKKPLISIYCFAAPQTKIAHYLHFRGPPSTGPPRRRPPTRNNHQPLRKPPTQRPPLASRPRTPAPRTKLAKKPHNPPPRQAQNPFKTPTFVLIGLSLGALGGGILTHVLSHQSAAIARQGAYEGLNWRTQQEHTQRLIHGSIGLYISAGTLAAVTAVLVGLTLKRAARNTTPPKIRINTNTSKGVSP